MYIIYIIFFLSDRLILLLDNKSMNRYIKGTVWAVDCWKRINDCIIIIFFKKKNDDWMILFLFYINPTLISFKD